MAIFFIEPSYGDILELEYKILKTYVTYTRSIIIIILVIHSSSFKPHQPHLHQCDLLHILLLLLLNCCAAADTCNTTGAGGDWWTSAPLLLLRLHWDPTIIRGWGVWCTNTHAVLRHNCWDNPIVLKYFLATFSTLTFVETSSIT